MAVQTSKVLGEMKKAIRPSNKHAGRVLHLRPTADGRLLISDGCAIFKVYADKGDNSLVKGWDRLPTTLTERILDLDEASYRFISPPTDDGEEWDDSEEDHLMQIWESYTHPEMAAPTTEVVVTRFGAWGTELNWKMGSWAIYLAPAEGGKGTWVDERYLDCLRTEDVAFRMLEGGHVVVSHVGTPVALIMPAMIDYRHYGRFLEDYSDELAEC